MSKSASDGGGCACPNLFPVPDPRYTGPLSRLFYDDHLSASISRSVRMPVSYSAGLLHDAMSFLDEWAPLVMFACLLLILATRVLAVARYIIKQDALLREKHGIGLARAIGARLPIIGRCCVAKKKKKLA
jgi:hypothetical protein